MGKSYLDKSYRVPKKMSRVKVIQSVSHPQMSDFFRGGQ